MNNDEIKEIFDIVNEKQYSSINKKINKNFQKFYLKKIKDNINQKNLIYLIYLMYQRKKKILKINLITIILI